MKKEIGMAVQQFVGWACCKYGTNDIIDLISSMGLTKKEWEVIKKSGDTNMLSAEDIQEVDEYFNKSN